MISPIYRSSPKSSQGRNLTGTARLVRDLAADIHANIQQWNNLHLQGVDCLKDITQEKQDKNYSETLQDLCDKLENICDTLDGIVENLEKIKNQLITVSALHTTADKLFITWPITKFGEVAETIHKAYHMETKLKRKLFENVAHNYTESWKMLHLAAWVYQPLITEDLTILLESLLTETGHR
ncbi:hypothetical protein PUN28_001796 [Cardiocondyla obscurior]|uniref:Cyclin-dependent kinase 2-interacting protein n=1 Tax=Cardiocondyla obscurior TaxID=286306 RepID=A0AAW2GR74_9HYME